MRQWVALVVVLLGLLGQACGQWPPYEGCSSFKSCAACSGQTSNSSYTTCGWCTGAFDDDDLGCHSVTSDGLECIGGCFRTGGWCGDSDCLLTASWYVGLAGLSPLLLFFLAAFMWRSSAAPLHRLLALADVRSRGLRAYFANQTAADGLRMVASARDEGGPFLGGLESQADVTAVMLAIANTKYLTSSVLLFLLYLAALVLTVMYANWFGPVTTAVVAATTSFRLACLLLALSPRMAVIRISRLHIFANLMGLVALISGLIGGLAGNNLDCIPLGVFIAFFVLASPAKVYWLYIDVSFSGDTLTLKVGDIWLNTYTAGNVSITTATATSAIQTVKNWQEFVKSDPHCVVGVPAPTAPAPPDMSSVTINYTPLV